MVKFYFIDSKNKLHTRTSKASSCRYNYENVNGEEKLVVRDYFTNKIVSKFNIPWNWRFYRVEI